MRLLINADGGCAPNPGEGRIGVFVRDERGAMVEAISRPIGYGTNNIAEWRSLIEAFAVALRMKASGLVVQMDSQMVVNQINGHWKVKDAKLKPLAAEARVLYNALRQLPCSVRVEWVPREENVYADALTSGSPL